MKPDATLRRKTGEVGGIGRATTRMWLAGSVLGIGLLAGLWATNPTAEDYQHYLERELALQAARMDPSIQGEARRRVERMVAVQGRQVMAAVVRDYTRRYSMGIGSVYISDISNVHLMTLGVASFLVPVSGYDQGIVALGRLLFQG